MENLPAYVYVLFIATVIATLFFLYMGTNGSKRVLIFCLAWLLFSGILAIKGFYSEPLTKPQHFLSLLLPPVFTAMILCFAPFAKGFREMCNPEWLTLLHTIRIGVEYVLLFLFICKQVPQLLTFEGRNFDILSGLTAPLAFYFGYRKKILGNRVLVAWNCICLGLLFNVVINAILSAPLPFQQFAFNNPNRAVFYFPFVWLPGFIVPAVLFSHLISIRKLLGHRDRPGLKPIVQK